MAAGLDLAGISALLTDWDTEGKGFVTGSAFKKGLGDLGFNLSSVRRNSLHSYCAPQFAHARNLLTHALARAGGG